MPKLKDRTGERYGRLIVIERAPNISSNRVAWKCKCDCGNEIIVAGNSLQSGNTQSCGCLNTETRRKLGLNNKQDLSGQVFGRLTVIEDTGKRKKKGEKGSSIIYKCKCECGNIVEIESNNLRSGNTMSCGCIGRSKGEFIIESILKEHNINYLRDTYLDKQLFLNSSNNPLRFDFIIKGKKTYVIEFDGYQHFYEPYNSKWEGLQVIHKRDLKKNNYCFTHSIPIIRIPYTHLNKIILQDLLLETSQFILTQENEGDYYGF